MYYKKRSILTTLNSSVILCIRSNFANYLCADPRHDKHCFPQCSSKLYRQNSALVIERACRKKFKSGKRFRPRTPFSHDATRIPSRIRVTRRRTSLRALLYTVVHDTYTVLYTRTLWCCTAGEYTQRVADSTPPPPRPCRKAWRYGAEEG